MSTTHGKTSHHRGDDLLVGFTGMDLYDID